MNEYVTQYVINYQNAPMMRFVMNVVLYVFYCFRKEDGSLWSMLQVIDRCYLPIELVCLCVCMIQCVNSHV